MDKWGGFLELPDGMAEPLGNAGPKGLHRLPAVYMGCNVCRPHETDVHVGFVKRSSNGYMRSSGSIPSMVRPEASTRLVAEHRASRESRTAPEDCSTGHCS